MGGDCGSTSDALATYSMVEVVMVVILIYLVYLILVVVEVQELFLVVLVLVEEVMVVAMVDSLLIVQGEEEVEVDLADLLEQEEVEMAVMELIILQI